MSSAEYNFSENPLRFEIVKELPPSLVQQIEEAIKDFLVASKMTNVDPAGFIQQTREQIANATYLGHGGEFWLMTENGKVLAYVLAHVTRDIDNSLTYWCGQAWVHPAWRGHMAIKMAWQRIRSRAKACLCKHIVVVSSRGTDAYCRWLGKGWHPYAALLKEDL